MTEYYFTTEAPYRFLIPTVPASQQTQPDKRTKIDRQKEQISYPLVRDGQRKSSNEYVDRQWKNVTLQIGHLETLIDEAGIKDLER